MQRASRPERQVRDRLFGAAGWATLGLALAALALAAPAEATNVGGTISVDTTWTLAGSPYVVTSSVTVQGTAGPDGVTTLTIEPGVEVRVQQSLWIQVGGNAASQPGALVADGTPASPILITSDQVAHTRGYWQYLYFADFASDSISVLDNVVVEYGGSGTANVYLYQSAPTISSLTSRQSGTQGLYLYNTNVAIASSTFQDNDEHGVFIYGGSPTFTSSSFIDNGLYGAYTNHGNPGFTSNTFDSNAQRPLRFNPDAAFSGNTFTASTIREVELLNENIATDRTLPDLADTGTGDPIAYVVLGTLQVFGTSGGDGVTTLTIAPGAELRFNSGVGLYVGSNSASSPGALVAAGTAAQPILFTSNQASPTRGFWIGLTFYDFASDAVSRLENVTIEYAGSFSNAALYLQQAAPKVRDCTVRESGHHGVYLYVTDATLTGCTVRDNDGHGVYLWSFTSGTPKFVDGTLRDNGLYGLYADASARVDVTGTLIKDNAQRPLRLHPNSKFTGNTYEGNTIQEIVFSGGTQDLDQTLPRLLDAVSAAPLSYWYDASVQIFGTAGGDGVTTLTVDPGVTVAFDDNGAVLNVGSGTSTSPGALVARGTAALPIVFTSHEASKAPGDWGYLYFHEYAAASALENVTVEYGGAGGVNAYMAYFYTNAVPLRDSVFRHSAGSGLYLYNANPAISDTSFTDNGGHGVYNYFGSPVVDDATFQENGKYGFYTEIGQPQVTDSVFDGNGQRPLRAHPNSLITGNTFDGNAIQEIEFIQGTQSADRTLVRYTDLTSSAALAYVYESYVTVAGTAGPDGVTTLTVAPGVTVKMESNIWLTFGSTTPGRLDARGTAALPIVFTSDQGGTKTRGYWGYLYLSDTAEGSALENVTIEYGGSGSYSVYLYSNDEVTFKDVVVRQSGGSGLYLYSSSPTITGGAFSFNDDHGIWNYFGSPSVDGATFQSNLKYGFHTDSGAPTVTDSLFKTNNQRPLRVHPESVITGNTFDGNVLHEVEFIQGTQTLDQSLPRVLDLTSGLPLTYVYTGQVTISGTDGSDGVTSLTVAPGVTVAFDQNVQMTVSGGSASNPGAIVADGTAALPIVFTSHQSGTKTAGWWGPLYMQDYASESVSVLRNLTIEYGGRSTAGLYLYRFSPTISDCTIHRSSNSGVYVYDADPVFERCTVSNSAAHGIYNYVGDTAVRDSTLRNNAQYGLYTQSGTPAVTGTLLKQNTQRPLRVAPDSDLAGNTYDQNTLREIEFNAGTHNLDKELPLHLDVTSGLPYTYVYTGNTIVQGLDGSDGVTTLTVAPGVTVAFDSNAGLTIGSNSPSDPGALVADGTESQRVVFTSHQSGTKTAGFWNYVYFYDYADEGISVLDNWTIEYGGKATAGLYLYRFSGTLTSLTVTKSSQHGVYVYDADPVLKGCTVQDGLQHGVYVQSGDPVLEGCLLKGNSLYGLYTNSGMATITGSTLQANKQRPLRLHPEAPFSGNAYRSNVIQEVEFNGGTLDTDQVLAPLVDADTAATLKYAYTGTIFVKGTDGADGVTSLTVEPGVTVLFDQNTYAQFGGSASQPGALNAVGTAAQNIVFSSHRPSPAVGDWGGLRFSSANAASTLDYVQVGWAGQSSYGNVYVYDSDVTITNSRFFRSSTYGAYLLSLDDFRFEGNAMDLNQRGLFISGGTDYVIEGNRFHNNSFGAYVGSGTATFARNRFEDNTNTGLYYAGSNSLVYDNVFRNTKNAEDQGSGNRWNLTKAAAPTVNIIGGAFLGGNRWSNYTGLDKDYDGLGDTLTPHKTIGKGLDHHPLTTPSEVVPDDAPPVTTIVVDGTEGENGWYISALTVTLSATDDSSGVKRTNYRLDAGATQVYDQTPFDFTGDGARTIAYWSTDNAGNVEAERSDSASIDATPPTLTAGLSGTLGPGGWYASDVVVTLTAADATSGLASREWSLDGGAYQAYTGPVTITGDGAHTLLSRAKDVAGNERELTTTVRIDTLPPVTTHALSGTQGLAGWWRSAVTATLTATDAGSGVASTSSRLDGGAWQPQVGPRSIAGEGAHALDYASTDNVGHVEATKSASANIDSVAPATTFRAGAPTWTGPDGLYVRSTSPLSLAATDATSGVASTKYDVALGGFARPEAEGHGLLEALLGLAPASEAPRRAPGEGPSEQAWSDYAGPFSLAGTDGARTVLYYSTDVAGNTEPTRTQVAKLDNTPPTLQLAKPRIGSLTAFSVYVETDSDWDYFADPVEVALGTGPLNPASHPPGDPPAQVDDVHERYRYAYVVAGSQLALTADATDPMVGGVASGMDRVAFYLDGALLGEDAAAPYALDWDTTTLRLGKHLLEVRAFDHLGNEATISVPVFGIAQPQDEAELQQALADLSPMGTTGLREGAPVVRVAPATFEAMLQAAEVRVARPGAVEL